MKIKHLCLANGDEYRDITVEMDEQQLLKAIDDEVFIKVTCTNGTQVLLNPNFVLSIEIGESRKLTAI
ncbi:hypothetical protein BHU72_11825 [Desulfuribacillus stibiiarsenatis]|uniref:Uncharacterized protein n=1 Tax=Desulfuribacillus stibiiarsenatis TaxID=1390249 RepID=A0A1E5L7S9_9FIRM|nr:hypothetical protein [Desulfuribacillus stibiiarsenatis]OEH86217.1 hypothetical protein BHU72_11825 [Desulfuribacillus stibiiarsenatis]